MVIGSGAEQAPPKQAGTRTPLATMGRTAYERTAGGDPTSGALYSSFRNATSHVDRLGRRDGDGRDDRSFGSQRDDGDGTHQCAGTRRSADGCARRQLRRRRDGHADPTAHRVRRGPVDGARVGTLADAPARPGTRGGGALTT